MNRKFIRSALVHDGVRRMFHQFLDRFVGKSYLETQVTPAAKTTSTTLTAAELLTRLLTANQGGAAAATYTLPLGTDLEAALVLLVGTSDLKADASFDFSITNISTNAAEDVTVATNTGWTLVGKMTVESNAAVTDDSRGLFRVRRTAASTFTLYRVV